MSVDILNMAVLANSSFKRVFLDILTSRMKSRYQLEIDDEMDKTSLNDALNSLQKAGLINKQAAFNSEWDTFYPTDKGLNARKLIDVQ